MTNLTGIFSALLTPFGPDERVDRRATERLVASQWTLGVHGLYVRGSSGKARLRFRKSRAKYLTLAAEIVSREMPPIVHVGAIATSDTLALPERTARADCYVISAIAPCYYGYSRGEVMEYFRTLAARAALPLIIYNFPGRASGFSTPELQELLSLRQIVGPKNTSPDDHQRERIIQSYHARSMPTDLEISRCIRSEPMRGRPAARRSKPLGLTTERNGAAGAPELLRQPCGPDKSGSPRFQGYFCQ